MENRTIYDEPTSKLIYYRVYQQESPYTTKEIDEALRCRPYIDFGKDSSRQTEPFAYRRFKEQTANSRTPNQKEKEYHKCKGQIPLRFKLQRTFTRKFIKLNEEEEKIRQRGTGLERYSFEANRDFFDTFAQIVNEGMNSPYSNKSFSFEDANKHLTWSEHALLHYIARRMVKIQEYRLKKSQKELSDIIKRMVFKSGLQTTPNEALIRNFQSEAIEEEILKQYFDVYMSSFKRTVCTDNLDKAPIDYPILKEVILFQNTPSAIKRRIIPSVTSACLWDYHTIDTALQEEYSLILGHSNHTLTDSIDSLQKTSINIPTYIKRKLR